MKTLALSLFLAFNFNVISSAETIEDRGSPTEVKKTVTYILGSLSSLPEAALDRIIFLSKNSSGFLESLDQISHDFKKANEFASIFAEQLPYDLRWIELFRKEFIDTVTDPHLDTQRLSEFNFIAKFLQTNRELGNETIKILPRGHAGKDVRKRRETVSKIKQKLGQFTSQYSYMHPGIFRLLYLNGWLKINYVFHEEDYKDPVSDLEHLLKSSVELPVDEFFATLDLKNKQEAKTYALPAYERIVAGDGTEQDIAYLEQFSRLSGLSTEKAVEGFKGTSKQLELTIRQYLGSLPWEYPFNYLRPSENPAIFKATLKSMDALFSFEEQVAFLIKNDYFMVSDPFKNDSDKYLKVHKAVILQALKEAAQYKPFKLRALFSAILKNMKYTGSKEDDAIIDHLVESGDIDSEIKTYIEANVSDPRKIRRWERALKISYLRNKDNFLEHTTGGYCAYIMNRFLPAFATAK